eukprot:1161407-Pelagomonas_calceolata.AAC.8
MAFLPSVAVSHHLTLKCISEFIGLEWPEDLKRSGDAQMNGYAHGGSSTAWPQVHVSACHMMCLACCVGHLCHMLCIFCRMCYAMRAALDIFVPTAQCALACSLRPGVEAHHLGVLTAPANPFLHASQVSFLQALQLSLIFAGEQGIVTPSVLPFHGPAPLFMCLRKWELPPSPSALQI